MPVVVQRQMVGETLLLVLFNRKSWTFFLSTFLTVPLRGVYESVMEAFGRISQHFLYEVNIDAVLGHGVGVPVVVQRQVFWSRQCRKLLGRPQFSLDMVLPCPSWCNDRCFGPDSMFMNPEVLDSVHQQSGGCSSCYTETGMHSAFCAEDR